MLVVYTIHESCLLVNTIMMNLGNKNFIVLEGRIAINSRRVFLPDLTYRLPDVII